MMFKNRPALRFVLLLVAGILLAHEISPGESSALLVCVVFLATSLAGVILKRPLFANAALHLCVVSLGFLLQSYHQDRSHTRIVEAAGLEEPVVIEGSVDGDLVRQENAYRFTLSSENLVRQGEISETDRRYLVIARKYLNSLQGVVPGVSVRLQGALQRMPMARNPGEFDYGRYLRLNDIHGVVILKESDSLKVYESGASTFHGLVGRVQKALYGALDRHHEKEHSSFIKGVVLGHREDISFEMKQSFMDTGTIHILAVSGSNVAVVALAFYSVLGLFRFPKTATTLAVIAALLGYMIITGLSPSVIRATIMAVVVLVGMALERKTDVYNSLAVAAGMLLLWDSNYLFDVGFQLSFAAVLSIVYFYPLFAAFIKRIPDWLEEIKGIDSVLKLFAVSLAAQIGTLPFTAYYFGRVSVVSILANLIVVPLSGLNTLLGIATMSFSFVSDFVASSYAALNTVFVSFLLGFVKVASQVPFAYVETNHVSLSTALFYYIGVFLVFNISDPSFVKKMAVAFLILANVLTFDKIVARAFPKLTVTMLDVGQGDAIIVEFPNGKTLLVDAGPKIWHYDAGEKIVSRFLKRRGFSSLDAVLISHPHMDHFGGLQSVFLNVNVARIIEGLAPPDTGVYFNYMKAASEKGATILQTGLGKVLTMDEDVRIYVVHPTGSEDIASNENNSSVVFKLEYGHTSMIFTGDAETEAETKLAKRYGSFLRSQVLKAGHHGSSTSSSDLFVRTVRPRAAMVSVGLNNKFRHPSPEVLGRMKQDGIDVARTDEEGAIIFQSNGKKWERVHWRN